MNSHEDPNRDSNDLPWKTGMVEHEGRPLALRVRRGADTLDNQAKYTQVALVSQEFSNVTAKGLPEATYNESLAEFDLDMHNSIEGEGDGLVVLVETFAGKRNYYAYVIDAARLKVRLDELQGRYPQHKLNVRGGADDTWKFYNYYRQRFSGWF